MAKQIQQRFASTRISHGGQTPFVRRLLITFEIACTVVLLIVTGLVVSSFSRVLNQPHDFNASHVVLAEVDLLSPGYEQPNSSGDSARSELIDRVLSKIRSNPGIEFAAITSTMPLSGDAAVHSMYRPDHPLPESEVPTANLRNISPGYFATMQTTLIAGRDFTTSERPNPQSAIISQRAAQAAWPDTQALGRKFKIDGRIYTVIGIAADARIANLKENIPVVYLPFWHEPPASVFFLVHTARTLDDFAPTIRRQVWDVDPEAAIPIIEMLDTQLVQSVAQERLQSIVLASFGIAAVVLAILGVYGVLAYSVSLRTPEFGVRVALGSSKVLLIRLVLVEALTPVGGGILLGLLASFAATRAIRNLLYETSPADPRSIVASVGILLAATLVAAFLPAYRPSRIDPMKVLRSE
jgi:predicted permease